MITQTMKDKKYGFAVEISKECIRSEYDGDGSPYSGYRETEYQNELIDPIQIWTKEYPTITSDHEIKSGEDAWVVWVEYTSGSTFGQEIRGYTEILGVFPKDKYNVAKELKEKCLAFTDYKTKKFKLSDGFTYEVYPSWVGYFDRLEEIHIQKVTVVD